MASSFTVKLRTGILALGLVGATAFMLPASAAPAAADKDTGSHTYLALGDSVVFGFTTNDGPAYVNAANFVGYPEKVGAAFDFNDVNASCPGEATGGFISATGADNGCRFFKATFPLHVSYPGVTQLAFATSYLAAHRHTKLVTVALGANDLFLLEHSCGATNVHCILAGLPAVLGMITANMHTILHALRPEFHGVLMVVNYYSLDYSDTVVGTPITQALNAAETASATADRAVVADVFSAFKSAAAVAGGKTCNAGLLNGSPTDPTLCDVHPSQSGQQLIANTVELSYRAATA